MTKTVMVTRYGFATIDANTDEEAIEIAKNMPIEDFNWSEDVEFDVLDFE